MNTPRTDHLDNSIVRASATTFVVMRDHARTLERELNASIERVKELEGALQTLLDAVDGNHVTVGDCNQARAALEKS